MNRIKVVKDRNYTTISNVILRDKRLSLKAKGLLVTVMGLPDTWDFTVQGIATTLKEGRDAITGAIAELIEFDYCTRVDERDADGKFIGIDYTFHEAPILSVVEPITENPITDNPPTGNPPQLSKQEELSKQREKDTVALFEFWKSTMNLNGNTFLTPKRENAIKSRLKQGYTVERIKNAIVGCSVSPKPIWAATDPKYPRACYRFYLSYCYPWHRGNPCGVCLDQHRSWYSYTQRR